LRFIDLLVSTVGFALVSPLFVVLAVLIRLTSPGPVFHRTPRVGKDGEIFRLFKFRSMVADAAKLGPAITASGDWRITPVGRLLRRTKVDELPQLFNVVKGEMSLVGPRPEDPRYLAFYTPDQLRILRVLPGITSAASLSYRHEERMLTGPDWETAYCTAVLPAKLAIDLEYLAKRTLWSDLKLILHTVACMLK
jgi:lipopolysaccharide/colanic/teichoic acid biosynthesis glycosyltransferase